MNSFAAVRNLFDTRCNGCHNGTASGLIPGGATRVKLSANWSGTTTLSDADLYTTLTTALPGTVPTCSTMVLVAPSDLANSFIVTKVSSAVPGCGGQMPVGCATAGSVAAPCLTAGEIGIITGWINANAPH